MRSGSGRSVVTAILATLSLGTQLSYGLEKHWIVNTDWLNSGNWLNGLLPEVDTRIIFPVETRHAVGLPQNADLRLAGIELPRDGIVALSKNGKLRVSERMKPHPKESRWLRETPFFWLDPMNWNASSEAAPHLERLPCQGDVIVLPASSKTFSVRLPTTRDIEIRAVRLADDNQTFERWEWRAMEGRREFIGPRFSVKYNPVTECENCHCQEGDLSAYSEEICSIIRPRCALPACEYPLKVEGHCCYYCGGRIRLSEKTLLSTTQRIVKKVLKGYEDRLSWHSRLTWDGQTEILITEKGPYKGINVVIATTDVESALRVLPTEMNFPRSLRTCELWWMRDGIVSAVKATPAFTAMNNWLISVHPEEEAQVLFSETSGGPLYDYRLAVALYPFLGALLLALGFFLLICPIFEYSFSQVWEAFQECITAIFINARVKNGKPKSFTFARFENVSEGVIQLTEEEEANLQLASGERFENPLYKSKRQTKSEMNQEQTINLDEPVSLMTLQKAAESEETEDIEMDIENFY